MKTLAASSIFTMALMLNTAASAGSIHVTCNSVESPTTKVKAIDVWVTYGKNESITSMRVVWTLADGSTVDRTDEYSGNQQFTGVRSWVWSGLKPGTPHLIDGSLTWVTEDIRTGKPGLHFWKYTEAFWPTPNSPTAGREVTVATGCNGTDGDALQ